MSEIQMPKTVNIPPKSIVNDFTITFSTINGSGSATSNLTLLRAIFKMGVPVNGKNIFPSNISGMPTWYTIRINKDGFLGRSEKHNIVVAMNPATITKELEKVTPGGVFFYADDIKVDINRDDIFVYPMPIKKIVKDSNTPSNLRDYISNMAYVGVVAQMLGIDLEKIHFALDFQFKGKAKAVESNYEVIKAAADWAAENLEKKDPFWVSSMHVTDNYIMTEGNTASALGAIYGGVQFSAWYPITPASTVPESMMEYLPKLRTDPETGKETYAIVQAEDELAAIGMTLGAGWAGLRSMTATSGPGLSLMAEYLGLAYYSEVPLVVWDVQRVGPSTGLPTRTAQGDITFVNFMSHGDTKFVQLFPSSINECFDFGVKSFDIAERLQTPIFIMTDLDLGMNYWMGEKFEFPTTPMDRGKVLWEKDLEEMLVRTKGNWGRYLDIDGDGIPYRTVAGNRHPKSAYFGRGTGHDDYARYNEEPEVWERLLNRLHKKFETAKTILPKPVIDIQENAEIGIIAYGSTDMAVKEARFLLEKEGVHTSYLRLRAIPFVSEVEEFIKRHKRVYVVEINQDGQMKQLLTVDMPDLATKLYKVAHIDGLSLTAKWIKESIMAQEK